VPALDDVIGTKVRALADRGAVRDLIDVHAASHQRTTADLETLGRRHARRTSCGASPRSGACSAPEPGRSTPSTGRAWSGAAERPVPYTSHI
jgi:hypothetical protein